MVRNLLFVLLLLLLSLPVAAQDGVPTEREPITAATVGDLERLGAVGYPVMLASGFVNDDATLAAMTLTGALLLDADDLSIQQFIPYDPNPFADLYATFVTAGRGLFTDTTASVTFRDATITIDLETGAQTVTDPEATAVQLATSPDGTYVLLGNIESAASARFGVIDAATGETRFTATPGNSLRGRTTAGAFTPDGEAVVTAALTSGEREQAVRIDVWEVPGGVPLRSVSIDDLDRMPDGLVITPDTIAVLVDEQVITFDRVTLDELAREPGVPPLLASPSGGVIARGEAVDDPRGVRVHLLDATTGATLATVADLMCADFTNYGFSPDGTRFYANRVSEDVIRAYDVATGARVGASPGLATYASDVAFADDLLYVAGGNTRPEPCATENNPANGAVIYDVTGPNVPVGQLATPRFADDVAIHDELTLLVGFTGLAAFADGERLFNAQTDDFRFVRDVAISPDGSLAAAYVVQQDAIAVWNVAGLTEATFTEPLALLPAGSFFWGDSHFFTDDHLIYYDDRSLRLWDTTGRADAGSFDLTSAIDLAEWRPDGLAFHARSGTLAVQVTDLTDEAQPVRIYLFTLDGATFTPASDFDAVKRGPVMTFSPDGSLLVLSETPGDIIGPGTIIYDAATGEPLRELVTSLMPVAFNADGTLLALGNQRSQIELFGIPAE